MQGTPVRSFRLAALAAVLSAGAITSCDRKDGEDPADSATVLGSGASSSPPGAPPSGPTAASGAVVTPKAPEADPSRLKLRGKPIQGGLLLATVEPKTRKVKFPGHRVVISEEGDFLIAFYRNAPPRETLTVTFPDGAVLEHEFEVEQREYTDDVIDGLPQDEVVLDTATKQRLHASNKRIEDIRKRYGKEAYYRDGFDWPVVGKITSRYGQQRILNGVKSGLHWGVDIAAPSGTPVRAPAAGKVVLAEKDVPLSGHVIILDHGHGLSSTFLHLSGFAVTAGNEVARGDVIGSVGMTGRATGPHLDWRVNFFQIRIDPGVLLSQEAWRSPSPDRSSAAAGSAKP